MQEGDAVPVKNGESPSMEYFPEGHGRRRCPVLQQCPGKNGGREGEIGNPTEIAITRAAYFSGVVEVFPRRLQVASRTTHLTLQKVTALQQCFLPILLGSLVCQARWSRMRSSRLETSRLSSAEAEKSLEEFSANQMTEKERKSLLLRRIWEQVNNVLEALFLSSSPLSVPPSYSPPSLPKTPSPTGLR